MVHDRPSFQFIHLKIRASGIIENVSQWRTPSDTFVLYINIKYWKLSDVAYRNLLFFNVEKFSSA